MTGLLLIVLGSALGIGISVGSRVIPDGKRKNNLLMALGGLLLLNSLATGVVTRREGQQAQARSKQQSELFRTEITSLKTQNADQLGDCNARVEALTTKFHTPVGLARNVSESHTTEDKVTGQGPDIAPTVEP